MNTIRACGGMKQAQGLLAGWMLLAWLLSGCTQDPPEVRLRARIAQMQEALEARKPGDFMQGVAEDFGSAEGMDRQALHDLLRLQVLRHARIGVSLGPLEVTVRGDRATVSFPAMTTGGQEAGLPDSARPWAVTSDWRDGADGWQLIHARWTPIL